MALCASPLPHLPHLDSVCMSVEEEGKRRRGRGGGEEEEGKRRRGREGGEEEGHSFTSYCTLESLF